MGKHKEYSEDFCNSLVNSKAKAAHQLRGFKQLVCKWVNIKECRGTLVTKPRSGQPRKTTERDDCQLCQMSKGDVCLTAPQITS